MLMGAHKTQRMACLLQTFLNNIKQVIGDETWVSFVNVETKEYSKQ
jgi:hypothetical protein